MATESAVAQLIGTVVTMLGGVGVAYITTRRGVKKASASNASANSDEPFTREDYIKLHADIIEVGERVEVVVRLLQDKWQWERDQQLSWRDRWDLRSEKERKDKL